MKVKLSQRILSTILTFALLFSMMSMTIVTTNAASKQIVYVDIMNVTRKYSLAGQIAEAINKKRAELNLSSLVLDEEMIDLSMARAAELSIDTKAMPLKNEPYTDLDEDSTHYESILTSTGTVDSIVSTLFTDVSTRAAVNNPNVTTLGVGVVTMNSNTSTKYICIRTTDYYTESDVLSEVSISDLKGRSDDFEGYGYDEYYDNIQTVEADTSRLSSLAVVSNNKTVSSVTMKNGETVSLLFKAGSAYILPSYSVANNSVLKNNRDGTFTATASGQTTVTMILDSWDGESYTRDITVKVNPADGETALEASLTLSASQGYKGDPFTGNVTVKNGTAPYTYKYTYSVGSVNNQNISSKSNVTGATDSFTYTPTLTGTYTITATVTDSTGSNAQATQTYTSTDKISVSLAANHKTVALGNSITLTATPTGGSGNITYQYTSTDGTAISSKTNTATFIPSKTGNGFTATVTATDSKGDTATASITYSVTNSMTVTLAAPKDKIKTGDSTTLTATATGGVEPITYTFTGASGISAGTTKNTAIFTPTAAGTYTIKVVAKDGVSNQDEATKLIYVSDGISVSLASSTPIVAAGGTVTLTATPSGALGKVTYKYTSSDGTAISSTTNTASFKPSKTGDCTVTVTASDETGYSATGNVTFKVTDTLGVTLTASKKTINYGDKTTLTATAVGGTNVNYTFSGASGITSSGNTATFTPTAKGTYTITVTARDSSGKTATDKVTITVADTLKVTLENFSGLTEVALNQSVMFNATASGGTGPLKYKYTYYNTAVDNGEKSSLTITANTAGTLAVKVTVTDANGYTAESNTCNVTVVGELNVTLTVDSDVKNYTIYTGDSITLAASSTGGYQPIKYSYVCKDKSGNTVSSGLTSDGNKVTFKPAAEGTYIITVTATDRDGTYKRTASQTVTVKKKTTTDPVTALKATISVTQADFIEGKTATITTTATGGTGTYKSYTYTRNGNAMSETGKTIIPILAAGKNTIVVTVTDSGGNTATATTTITAAALVKAESLTASKEYVGIGDEVTFTAKASGGYSPYNYLFKDAGNVQLASGTGNTLTVKPTAAGTYTVSVTVTDKNGNSGSTAKTTKSVKVAKKLSVKLAADSAIVAKGSTIKLTAVPSDGFGNVTYSYAYKNGSAISGTSNTLSITPTATGDFTVVVTAKDAGGYTATAEASFKVTEKVEITSFTTSKANVFVNDTTTVTAAAKGGSSSYNYTYTSSNNAAVITSNGNTATVKPTAAGSYTITVKVTDKNNANNTATKTVTFTAAQKLSVGLTATPTTVTTGSEVTLKAAATGGFGTITYKYVYNDSTVIPGITSSTTFTPSKADTYTVKVAATDSAGNTAAATATVKVTDKLSITSLTAAGSTVVVGGSTTVTAAVTGSSSVSYTYTCDKNTLAITPNGNTATVTPSAAGTYTITVKATDKNNANNTATKTVTITAIGKLSVQLTASPTVTTAGNKITFTATPSGGSGTISYSYKYKNGSAIAGTANSVTITPSTAGSYTVVVTATDSAKQTATAEASVTVTDKLAVTLSAAKNKVNVGDSTTLTAAAAGGTGPYTYTYSTVSGLTASGNTATYKPTASGSVTITVTVKDKNNNTATATQTIQAAQKLSVKLAPNAATVNTGSSVTLTATPTGGFGNVTYSYAYKDGAAIAGTSEKVTVTPSRAGSYTVTVTAKDSAGNTASADAAFTVTDKLTVSLDTTKTQMNVGDTATLTAAASGGAAPYTYTYSTASGLTANGNIATYKPTASGNVTITVTVKDKNNNTATATKTIQTAQKLSVSLAASAKAVNTGSSVTLTATPTGGFGNVTYSYAYKGGSAISGNGNKVTVTPSKAGSYTVTVTAKDSAGNTASADASFTVTDQLSITGFTAAKTALTVGETTTVKATAAGGSSISYTFTCNNNALAIIPNGNSAAVTPTAAGTYTITVRAVDGDLSSNSAAATVTITATDKLTVSLSATPSVVTTGNAVTLKAAATGGSGTISYKFAYKNSTVIASGTAATASAAPTRAGTYNIVVTATDAAGNTATAETSFIVTDKLAVSLDADTTMVNVGDSLVLTATAAGGSGTVTYSYNTVTGLTADGAKATYKPTTPAAVNITVTATDQSGNKATATKTIRSSNRLSVQLTASQTSVMAGSTLRLTATATSGFAPVTYKYAYKNGAAIAGTSNSVTINPPAAGSYTVVVTATDASGTVTNAETTFKVYDKLAVTLDATSDMVNVGDTTQLTAKATGGSGTITYTYNTVTGLTADGAKASYKPASAVNATITVTATDQSGNKATASKMIKAANKLSVNLTSNLTAANTGSSITLTAAAAGGFSPVTYSFTYKDGTAIESTSNRVTVTPAKAGSYTVIVTAKDTAGNTAVSTASFTITDKVDISSLTAASMVNVGDSTAITAAVTGGSSSLSYSFTSNNSAAVITQNGNTAAFKPTVAGSYTVTVKVTDNNNKNNTASRSVIIKAADKLSVSLEANASVIALGSSVTIKAVPVGGFSPVTYAYAYKDGTAITGTSASVSVKPESTGKKTIVVTATDANKNVAKAEVTVNVTDKLEITSLAAAKDMINLNDQTIVTAAAKGGTSDISYTFTCNSNTVDVAASGNKATITPTVAGTYYITVKAVDNNNPNNTATKSITIKAASKLTLDIAATPAIVIVGESVPLRALPTGGFSPITYEYVYNDGTVIDGTGASTYTKPTKAGVHTITVTATDAAGNTASSQTSFTVADKLEVILESESQMVNVGDSTVLTATAAGGTAPITYTYSTTDGLTANGNKAVFKPTTAGNITITVTAHDSNNKTAAARITIKTANKLSVSLAANNTAVIAGSQVTLTATPKDGFGNVTYQYAYSDGTAILGTTNRTTFAPTKAGTHKIIVTATDIAGNKATSEVTITVADKLEATLSANKDSVYVNEPITLTAASTGGLGSVSYTYSGAAGITANGSSAVFKPTAAGTYTITVTARDSKNNTSAAKITVTVTAAVVNNSTISTTSATVGQKITVKGAAGGGTAPYAYAFYYKSSSSSAWTTAGNAYTANKANLQFGTAGTYDVKVIVIDANGRTAEKTFTVTVK